MYTSVNPNSSYATLFSILTLLLSIGAFAPTAATAALCSGFVEVPFNATTRGELTQEEVRFRLTVDTPGLVTLEVETGVVSRLTLLPSACEKDLGAQLQQDAVLVEASARHLAFAALRPGEYVVGLRSEDSQPRDNFRLTADFVATDVRERSLTTGSVQIVEKTLYRLPELRPVLSVVNYSGEVGLDNRRVVLIPKGELFKDEDHEVDPDPYLKDEDHEVDPDPYLKDEDHEVDPDPYGKALDPHRRWTALITRPQSGPYTKDEDHEVDPDPYLKGSGYLSGRWIRFAHLGGASRADLVRWLSGWTGDLDSALHDKRFRILSSEPLSAAPMLFLDGAARCPGAGADDHADTFSCATPVAPGQLLSATIDNGWGDDRDVYLLRLKTARTVGVGVRGDGISVELYDRFARRLESAEPLPGAVLTTRSLDAGEYFIRVSGQVPGSYVLAVE